MIQAIIPEIVVDLRALSKSAENLDTGELAQEVYFVHIKTRACCGWYAQRENPAEDRQEEVARD